MTKILVSLAVVIALSLAGKSVFDAYQRTQPPYAVGECIEVEVDGKKAKIAIIDNIQDKKVSVVVVEVTVEGITYASAIAAEYSELRSLDGKKVSCEAN